MSDMQEIELKFQVPAAALEALKAEMASLPDGELPPQRLQAAYFDTPQRKLARARAALRVRQEDDDWVQTLKAAGANAMTRLEDNQPVPPFSHGQTIRPDLSLHVDAHVRQALVRDLNWQPAMDPRGEQVGLVQLYRTDMLRSRAKVDTFVAVPRPACPGEVEMALDLGEIAAGGLRMPVRELEIELVDGHAQAVLDVARGLVLRHGLWLDTQTKAHRGDQLAREAELGQPSPMPPARPRARIKADATATQRWLAGLDAALEQIGACQSEVALHDSAAAGAALDLTPWIQGWVCGLRRLALVWRRAPEGLLAEPVRDDVRRQVHALLAKLRPAAGQHLDADAAGALARSGAPTLLALDVLAVIAQG